MDQTLKSEHLLAKGYEIVKDELAVPVGISNSDLDIEILEPENAQKLSIDVAPQKEKLNLYVFRPAKVEDGEKTPVVYFIHGGGYHLGNTAVLESKIQGVADGCNATVGQLKGLPETFIIVGSIDLFCDEDMDYARKLMEAGVFTELHVEPGVPHAYEELEGTLQTERFYELRDQATARMLGVEYNSKDSSDITGFGDFLRYLFGK